MAWTESYHCDVCGRAKNEDQDDWWLAWNETISPSPSPNEAEQTMIRITPWSLLLSHSPGVIHLCGSRCAQTELDRWMTPVRENLRAEEAAAQLEAEDEAPAPGA